MGWSATRIATIRNQNPSDSDKLAILIDLLQTGGGAEWETVAASQTDQVLGATGATGDLLSRLLVVPATTSPGVVQIKDGAGTAITVFVGGVSSVASLVPFSIPLNLVSLTGAWKITTGANVSVLAAGDFTD